MSKMEADIRVPPVPDKLTVDLPGVSKGATIGLDNFTTPQPQAGGRGWAARRSAGAGGGGPWRRGRGRGGGAGRAVVGSVAC